MLNISWVTPLIAVGSAFRMEDAPKIRALGIDAIIEIRSRRIDDRNVIEQLGMRLLHIDVADRCSPTEKQITEIFNFALPLLRQNKKIFVHCKNGYGRSPLVAISLLVKKGMGVADAFHLVQDKHPSIAFTQQQEQFMRNLIDYVN